MQNDHLEAGGHRRSEGVRVPDEIEWIVSRAAVPGADCRARVTGPELELERKEELRRRVREGVYKGAAMMDAVARRILQSGDL
jgi:hypothetical protein